MKTEIVYANEKYFKSLRETINQVALEKIYIEMIAAPELEIISEFQQQLITNNWPVFYAVEHENVMGWADILPFEKPRFAHRGTLGMGLLKSARGKGLGTQLLKAALDHAKLIGLEKVELTVYPQNEAAIALYKKCGFLESGIIKHYRKFNGVYFDVLCMEKFL